MLNRCRRCNVEVDKNLTNCPLCGAYIERAEEDDNTPPAQVEYKYPKVSHDFVFREIMLRIFIYACIISIGICFLVNYLVSGRIFWAYHVLFGWFVFWCTLGRSIFFKMDFRRQAVWYSVFAGVICYYIQSWIYGKVAVTEAENWALVWAIPAFLLGGIAVLFLCLVLDYKNWIRYAMPLTIMCLITIIPVIAAAAMYGRVHFMICLCMAVGVVAVLLLMVLGRDKYFLELKKKLFL